MVRFEPSRSRGAALVFLLAMVAFLATAAPGSEPKDGAATRSLKLPVTRDLWLCQVGEQADGNNGGSPRWKLKSNQEMTLFDVDLAPLRGRTIKSATLHVRSPGAPHLLRVTVGSVGAEWVEGTGNDYAKQASSSTFNFRRHPDVPWTVPGSDLCAVVLGAGGTLWRTADAFPPDSQGWQRIAVDPSIVAARLAGLSYGFLAFDDTGTEWTRDGQRFQMKLFPNRYLHSRESNSASAPYLTVEPGERDDQPPASPTEPRSETADLPAGEAWLSWVTPRDAGPAGTLGFSVQVDGRDVPRYLIPPAGEPGQPVRMHLRDLRLAGGATVKIAVRAVDAAGNVGTAVEFDARTSDRIAAELPGRRGQFATDAAPLPQLGGARIAVLDELDKVHPTRGELIPAQPAHYLSANHLWNAQTRQVRLSAARNEFVACQILFQGEIQGVRPELKFPTAPGVVASFGRYVHVSTPNGPLPDPIVPLAAEFSVPAPDEKIDGQRHGSLLAELFVPHDAPPGEHAGTLTLRAGGETLELPVRLRVWNFTLPDELSFLPEMNCYGLPDDERGYYRQAHRHRTVLNRVPYYQNGQVADGCAPTWNGRSFDWTAWDRRFAPLLDGSAFADLPRKGVPVDSFYLPLHENWPTPIADAYNEDYWADRAFPASYRAAFVSASRQYAEHLHERGWNKTLFQFFLNGKNDFKQNGWSRASSPWLLDEPSNFQDYWALAWFGSAFHEGVRGAQTTGRAKLLFRGDISRPQWQRTTFDGLLDFNVVSGALRQYHRMVLDRKRRHGELLFEYGGTNAITDANVQPLGWCLDAWSLGCDGVLPWQTIGTDRSWQAADELSLFYPARGGAGEPIPSIRLKAYRRGQQDVEYLTLLASQMQQPRWATGERVREALRLQGRRQGTGFTGGEDAGRIHYSQLRPQDAWALRVQIGEVLSQAAVAPRRQLVDLRTPPREPIDLVANYVARGEQPPRTKPAVETDSPNVATVTKTLQGRAAVRDALIDLERPEQTLGAAPRDNALRKTDRSSSALLVRFDLSKLDLPADARVVRAKLHFYVWDPSSRADTKVEARALRTAWDEATVAWRRPAEDKSWRGDREFSLAQDTAPAAGSVIVKPDQGGDTADPPIEYAVDVTELVRSWRSGQTPNEGVALVAIPDRAIDDGHHTRFQAYASEHPRVTWTPKLTVEMRE